MTNYIFQKRHSSWKPSLELLILDDALIVEVLVELALEVLHGVRELGCLAHLEVKF